jgi:HAD superfamily hydrolase (TIGR01458 family)
MIKGVLMDLGGVVYVGSAALPGAVEALARLKAEGLALRYITNTTRRSRQALVKMLADMGLSVAPEEIFMPAVAARRYLEARGLAAELLVHPNLEEDFAGLAEGKGRAVVIGDAGEGFSYVALNRAFRSLAEGAEFIALANNRSFRDADGELSLDAGPFVAALTFATGREPLILGKPAAGFFGAALESMACRPDQAVMIGDDAENDVAGAMVLGMPGVLVRTGKYRPGDEDTVEPAPTVVLDDLPAAVRWILER